MGYFGYILGEWGRAVGDRLDAAIDWCRDVRWRSAAPAPRWNGYSGSDGLWSQARDLWAGASLMHKSAVVSVAAASAVFAAVYGANLIAQEPAPAPPTAEQVAAMDAVGKKITQEKAEAEHRAAQRAAQPKPKGRVPR